MIFFNVLSKGLPPDLKLRQGPGAFVPGFFILRLMKNWNKKNFQINWIYSKSFGP